MSKSYACAAPASPIYSNMGSDKPLTADNLRAMWEKMKAAQSADRASGSVVTEGSWFYLCPDLSTAHGRAATRRLALAFEAIVPMLQRRAIDDILREDARKHPAFATARRSAVLAACEMWGDEPPVLWSVRGMCNEWLHQYEKNRGSRSAPSIEATRYAQATFGECAAKAYERARGL